MRRLTAVLIGVVAIVVANTVDTAHIVHADYTGAGAAGRTIDVSSGLNGHFSGGRPANYQAPCNKDRLPPGGKPGVDYSTQNPTIHLETDPFTGAVEAVRNGHWNLGLQVRKAYEFEGQTYYAGLSFVTCDWTRPDLDDDGEPDRAPSFAPWNGVGEYIGAYWYPIRPQPSVMIPAMFARAQRELGDPVLSWPNMNPDGNWLYVRIPMAYTLQPIGFVRITARVENELGVAEAWVQATPTRVEVSANGQSSSCRVGDAMTDHGRDENPPCAVVFDRVGRGRPVTVTLTWAITSSVPDANLPETLTTTSTGAVDVAEIQALVEPRR